jgi:type III secretion protein T
MLLLVEIKTFLLALTLIVPRGFVCLAILPGFGTRTLVGVPRNAVSMAIALPAVLPTYFALKETPPDLLLAMILAFKEGILGVILGTLMAIPIWVIQSVGSIIDLQRTPIQTQNLNPSQDQDASALGSLILQAAVIVMIEAGLYLAMTRTLLDSYAAWPVVNLTPPLDQAQLAVVLKRAGDFLSYVVLYTAPVIIPLLLIEAAFAMLAVFAPSVQVSQYASPIKCLVALIVLLMYWNILSHYVSGDFSHQLDLIRSLYQRPGSG